MALSTYLLENHTEILLGGLILFPFCGPTLPLSIFIFLDSTSMSVTMAILRLSKCR